MTLPEYFGVPSFSPFLNYKIVKSMLMIKTERRINRQWQRDYFKSLGLDFENFKLKISKLNSLSVDLVNGYEFEKLSSSLLKVYFKQDIIEDINQIGDWYIDNLIIDDRFISTIGKCKYTVYDNFNESYTRVIVINK
jgi:hypothetical protein